MAPRKAPAPSKNGPSWLDVVDGQYVANERADIIVLIYVLAAEGKGPDAIIKELEQFNLYPIGRRKRSNGKPVDTWDPGNIDKLLKSRAPCGYMKTKTNELLCYPPIISEAFWKAVQTMRGRPSGGPKTVGNLFSGLLFCRECGKALKFRNFGYQSYIECIDKCIDRLPRLKLELMMRREVEVLASLDVFIDDESRDAAQTLIKRLVARIEVGKTSLSVTRRDKTVVVMDL